MGRFALRHSSTAGAIAGPVNSRTTKATSRDSGRSSPHRRQVELVGIEPTLLLVQEPSPDEVKQRSRETPAAEPSRRKRVQALPAEIARGEHDGQQPRGTARQRCQQVGLVVVGDGSGDGII